MKILILFLLVSSQAWSKDFELSEAKAHYTVKHLIKTVKGESRELKGKMQCENSKCEFLVAIPTKSFISSDSNRDLNMQTILEVIKFPLVTIKGELDEAILQEREFKFDGLVSFHGVEKSYRITINNDKKSFGHFVVKLSDHRVERPSLLTVAIDNEVPIDFEFNWK
ncbi:MAG: YceI family protein [Bacteriovoracaceae bacterium]|nr:YceI family protein [Bacteriovoracaceae bacterium]